MHDLVRRPGEMSERTFTVPAPAQWGEGLVSVAEGEPIDLDVRLESVHEGILVSADIDTEYRGQCGRCLTDIAEPLKVEIQELFGYPGGEADDFEVQDDHVDLETPVRDAIVLSLPFQPVCEPDCLGLDPVTGEKLVAGAEPAGGATIDPRWAALTAYTTDHDGVADDRDAGKTEKS